MGAFANEKEVLLVDGSKFEVMLVNETVGKNGKPLNVVVLKYICFGVIILLIEIILLN